MRPARRGRPPVRRRSRRARGDGAVLALRGSFPVEGIHSYRELGSMLEGHSDMTRTPGLETSGGPLGMGLSVAVGRAMGLRYEAAPRTRVSGIPGDGESNEGDVWEAAMAAAHSIDDRFTHHGMQPHDIAEAARRAMATRDGLVSRSPA